MERVIDMMDETLRVCERAQRSTQYASHRMTFLFAAISQRRLCTTRNKVDPDPIWATETI
jgi:hypothetical protein